MNNILKNILFVFLLLTAPGSASAQSYPQLVDVTEETGITFTHSFGDDEMSNLIESNEAGCAFFDYNNDGNVDIYLVNGAYIKGISHVRGRTNAGKLFNTLYKNNGDGTFIDVSNAAGVAHEGMGMAALAADYDNDGDKDLFVSNWGPNVFYENNGDGTFTDKTAEAGLEHDVFGIGATFLDYDGDGFLDLYLGNYIDYDPDYNLFYAPDGFPGPLSYHGQPDVLYRNNGDGTFSDVTEEAGVYNPEGRAMGITSADIDNDGDWDIFVANDAMQNYLYQNNGDGTFTNIAPQTATGFGQNGEATSAMSGEFGDIDLDGNVDLVVPDMAYSCIYKNTGMGYFEEMSARLGMAAACGQYTSWSGNFFDFDHDGWLDMFITNGHAHRLSGEEDLLLRNDQGKRFINISDDVGEDFQDKFVSRGSAVGDFDNDGDMDILELNLNDRARLLRNDGGNKGNWLMLRLTGTTSNRDAIGTTVRLTTNGQTQVRWKMSSSGYLSQSDERIHFGIGQNSTVDSIELIWPTGEVQTLKDIKANQVLDITEPAE